MKKLDVLRNKIGLIDKQLMELIKKRLDIAKEIGKIKKSKGLPLKNWELEKKIIKSTKERSVKLGISKNFIVEIMREIIKESCNIQEITHFTKFEGEKENIFIIGANGKMGKWFSDFFQIKGHNILKYDIKKNHNIENFTEFITGLKSSSVALIATPIKTIPTIINQIIDFKYRGVVFDIASIKTPLLDSLEKAIKYKIPITSIHPLFGPDTKILSDKIICFCDLGNDKANSKVESLFKDTAVSIFRTSVSHHDLIISYILNLSHLVNIIYIKILKESGFDYKTLKQMGSTTFFSQIKTAKSVISEDSTLYFDIQTLNGYKQQLLRKFRETFDETLNSIENNDIRTFNKIMSEGKKWIKE